MEKLAGDYVAGFVDGEGCFALKYRQDKQNNINGKVRTYLYWNAEFSIVLRSDDSDILFRIKDTLGCGTVTVGKSFARYSVQNPIDLKNKIVPFFEQYPLQAKKSYDYELWKRGVYLIVKSRQREVNAKKGIKGFIKNTMPLERKKVLHELRRKMSLYKSHRSNSYKYFLN